MRSGINLGQLYGRVRQVKHSGSYRVRLVRSGEDVRIRRVTGSAHSIGQWKMMSFEEDITIQLVTSGEDFAVRYLHFGESIINLVNESSKRRYMDEPWVATTRPDPSSPIRH